MKPNIEVFLKTLKKQKTDFIPLAELGIHPDIKSKIIGRPVSTLADDVEFWYKTGYDYIKIQPVADFNPAKIGGDQKESDKIDSPSNFNWASEGNGIIGSWQDFERFVFPEKSEFNYSKFEQVKKLLPEGMGVVGQYGDIFTMTWEMMGFEQFSFSLFENPELIDELNNRLGYLVLSMFEYFAQCDDVDALWYSDDIAYTNGLLMPPDVLDKYLFKWLKKIGDLAAKYNKPLIYHTDGVLYEVFDRIIECGVDAIHPIEPKAMQFEEVRDKVGKELCLIGNIDVDILARGSEEDVVDLVNKNLRIIEKGGSYCIGSSNSIPAYVKVENYLAMNNHMLKMRR